MTTTRTDIATAQTLTGLDVVFIHIFYTIVGPDMRPINMAVVYASVPNNPNAWELVHVPTSAITVLRPEPNDETVAQYARSA